MASTRRPLSPKPSRSPLYRSRGTLSSTFDTQRSPRRGQKHSREGSSALLADSSPLTASASSPYSSKRRRRDVSASPASSLDRELGRSSGEQDPLVTIVVTAPLESHTGRETTCFDIHGGCRLILRDEDVTKFAINMSDSGKPFHSSPLSDSMHVINASLDTSLLMQSPATSTIHGQWALVTFAARDMRRRSGGSNDAWDALFDIAGSDELQEACLKERDGFEYSNRRRLRGGDVLVTRSFDFKKREWKCCDPECGELNAQTNRLCHKCGKATRMQNPAPKYLVHATPPKASSSMSSYCEDLRTAYTRALSAVEGKVDTVVFSSLNTVDSPEHLNQQSHVFTRAVKDYFDHNTSVFTRVYMVCSHLRESQHTLPLYFQRAANIAFAGALGPTSHLSPSDIAKILRTRLSLDDACRYAVLLDRHRQRATTTSSDEDGGSSTPFTLSSLARLTSDELEGIGVEKSDAKSVRSAFRAKHAEVDGPAKPLSGPPSSKLEVDALNESVLVHASNKPPEQLFIWQYCVSEAPSSNEADWQSYGSRTTTQLEAAWQSGRTWVQLSEGMFENRPGYTVNWQDEMVQSCGHHYERRAVRRVPVRRSRKATNVREFDKRERVLCTLAYDESEPCHEVFDSPEARLVHEEAAHKARILEHDSKQLIYYGDIKKPFNFHLAATESPNEIFAKFPDPCRLDRRNLQNFCRALRATADEIKLNAPTAELILFIHQKQREAHLSVRQEAVPLQEDVAELQQSFCDDAKSTDLGSRRSLSSEVNPVVAKGGDKAIRVSLEFQELFSDEATALFMGKDDVPQFKGALIQDLHQVLSDDEVSRFEFLGEPALKGHARCVVDMEIEAAEDLEREKSAKALLQHFKDALEKARYSNRLAKSELARLKRVSEVEPDKSLLLMFSKPNTVLDEIFRDITERDIVRHLADAFESVSAPGVWRTESGRCRVDLKDGVGSQEGSLQIRVCVKGAEDIRSPSNVANIIACIERGELRFDKAVVGDLESHHHRREHIEAFEKMLELAASAEELESIDDRKDDEFMSDTESIESEERTSSTPWTSSHDKQKKKESLFIFDRDDFGDGLLDDSDVFNQDSALVPYQSQNGAVVSTSVDSPRRSSASAGDLVPYTTPSREQLALQRIDISYCEDQSALLPLVVHSDEQIDTKPQCAIPRSLHEDDKFPSRASELVELVKRDRRYTIGHIKMTEYILLEQGRFKRSREYRRMPEAEKLDLQDAEDELRRIRDTWLLLDDLAVLERSSPKKPTPPALMLGNMSMFYDAKPKTDAPMESGDDAKTVKTVKSPDEIQYELERCDSEFRRHKAILDWFERTKAIGEEEPRTPTAADDVPDALSHTKRMTDDATRPASLDPDAAARLGVPFHEKDVEVEEGLMKDIWKLIRAGKLSKAIYHARAHNSFWRADSLSGALRHNPNDTDELSSGNTTINRWRQNALKLSRDSKKPYESIVYGSLSGNVESVFGWEECEWSDAMWAMYKHSCDAKLDKATIAHYESEPFFDDDRRVALLRSAASSASIHDAVATKFCSKFEKKSTRRDRRKRIDPIEEVQGCLIRKEYARLEFVLKRHAESSTASEAFLEFAVHLYFYMHPNCAWSFERQMSDIAREGHEELLPTGQAILSRYLRRMKDDCDTDTFVQYVRFMPRKSRIKLMISHLCRADSAHARERLLEVAQDNFAFPREDVDAILTGLFDHVRTHEQLCGDKVRSLRLLRSTPLDADLHLLRCLSIVQTLLRHSTSEDGRVVNDRVFSEAIRASSTVMEMCVKGCDVSPYNEGARDERLAEPLVLGRMPVVAEFADPAIVALHAELAKHPIVEEYQKLALQWRSIDKSRRGVLPGITPEAVRQHNLLMELTCWQAFATLQRAFSRWWTFRTSCAEELRIVEDKIRRQELLSPEHEEIVKLRAKHCKHMLRAIHVIKDFPNSWMSAQNCAHHESARRVEELRQVREKHVGTVNLLFASFLRAEGAMRKCAAFCSNPMVLASIPEEKRALLTSLKVGAEEEIRMHPELYPEVQPQAERDDTETEEDDEEMKDAPEEHAAATPERERVPHRARAKHPTSARANTRAARRLYKSLNQSVDDFLAELSDAEDIIEEVSNEQAPVGMGGRENMGRENLRSPIASGRRRKAAAVLPSSPTLAADVSMDAASAIAAALPEPGRHEPRRKRQKKSDRIGAVLG